MFCLPIHLHDSTSKWLVDALPKPSIDGMWTTARGEWERRSGKVGFFVLSDIG